MTLALDLGNSALKAACFAGDEVLAARFDTSGADWPGDFSRWLADLGGVERAGIASVVPGRTADVADRVAAAGHPVPVVLAATMPLPLRLAYRTPGTLGMDRLAAALAAWNHFGRSGPVVALDAGTAVTCEVVRAGGIYAGGSIAPGPRLLAGSLRRGTAQLPDVPFTLPSSPIGDDTVSALQSGLAYGFLDGVAGMLGRLRAELGAETRIAATGGWASWLVAHGLAVDAVRPHLVLEGIRDIVEWGTREEGREGEWEKGSESR